MTIILHRLWDMIVERRTFPVKTPPEGQAQVSNCLQDLPFPPNINVFISETKVITIATPQTYQPSDCFY